jgi:hypothetical protein
MEIKPSSSGTLRRFAEVTFDSVEERYRFGLSLPPYKSRESWRWTAYVARPIGLPSYATEEYPRSVTIPYAVLGQAAVGLAEAHSPDSEAGRIDKNMQEAVLSFLHDPSQTQPPETEMAAS